MSLGQLGRGAYDLGGSTLMDLTFGLYDAEDAMTWHLSPLLVRVFPQFYMHTAVYDHAEGINSLYVSMLGACIV